MADYISFQPSDHFTPKLYTGNASSSHAITGVGFQPDWVWIKGRNYAESNRLFDVVRGPSNYITSNSTGQQSNAIPLTSFDSDGFTIGTSDGSVNGSYNYVAWNWKGGGTGATNNVGSVESTVSANTTAGISIVKYTNPGSGTPFTVGHGLGTTPKMIMIKNLTGGSQNWGVYHSGIGFGKYIQLNTTISEATANLITATSDTTFSTYYDHHSTGVDLIAYCFSEIQGFSSIGSYVGNSSTYGKFIHTGFRPALVMAKRYDSGSEDWNVFDNKRIGYNVSGNDKLYWNLSSSESTTGDEIDFLANGFKWRTTNGGLNNNGGSYIYLAFAEQPFVASNETPAVAR
tara:strand:+ start:2716 stop:3747 length:1032 start_codon:yes stop_codon:yes gene_type:complete